MAKLNDDEVAAALTRLDGWTREDDAISREFVLKDFVAAIGLIAQIGLLAERANHHPTLENTYNRVRVLLSTHDEGGITEKDVALAEEITARAG